MVAAGSFFETGVEGFLVFDGLVVDAAEGDVDCFSGGGEVVE